MTSKIIILILGGSVGTLARYGLSGVIYRISGSGFPYGTLVVNTLGCLIIGFLLVLTERKFLLGPEMRLLLMIGFCGAFTTFSTFIFESSNLIRDGETMKALVNVVGGVLIGFAAFRIGLLIGEII